jgi:hypothetical protein
MSCRVSDVRHVAQGLEGALAHSEVTPGVPIQPMLGQVCF